MARIRSSVKAQMFTLEMLMRMPLFMVTLSYYLTTVEGIT